MLLKLSEYIEEVFPGGILLEGGALPGMLPYFVNIYCFDIMILNWQILPIYI